MDKHFRRNIALAVFHIHELEVHRSSLGTAAVYRHLKFLHVHDLLEPSLVEILGRIHINPDDERTSELGLQSIYLLVSQTHLQTKIIEVQLVIHVFRPDGHHLHTVDNSRVRGIHTELGRREHTFLNLLRSRD